MVLGTHTKFQLEILAINVISSNVYFREIILESSRNVGETIPSLYEETLWSMCNWNSWIHTKYENITRTEQSIAKHAQIYIHNHNHHLYPRTNTKYASAPYNHIVPN